MMKSRDEIECQHKMYEVAQGFAFICGIFGGCLALINAINEGKIIVIGSVFLCLIGYLALVFAIININSINKQNHNSHYFHSHPYTQIHSFISPTQPDSEKSSGQKSTHSDEHDLEHQSWDNMVHDTITPIKKIASPGGTGSPTLKKVIFHKPSIITKEELIIIIDAIMIIKLQTDRDVKYSYTFLFKNEYINATSSSPNNAFSNTTRGSTITMLHEYQIAYHVYDSKSTLANKNSTRDVVVTTSLHDITGQYSCPCMPEKQEHTIYCVYVLSTDRWVGKEFYIPRKEINNRLVGVIKLTKSLK